LIRAGVLFFIFGVLSVEAALPGRDWWFNASADTGWINKPLPEIQAAAERGDAAGQYYLGRAYFFGQSGERDMNNAFLWIRRSAEQGYAQGQLLTSRFHYLGLATRRDPAQGFLWASRAAQNGNVDAMALLGMAHSSGDGTPRDAGKAREWFLRGAAAALESARNGWRISISKARAARHGGPNYVEALHWYERAASNGMASANLQVAPNV